MFRKKCKHPVLKIEADFQADPIWCNECGFNLDIEDFQISEELEDELFNWVENYKKVPKTDHNKLGNLLTEKVRKELGPEYNIIFVPTK